MSEAMSAETRAAALAGQLLNRARAASLIAHDLGSPLGSILLYADLLLAGELEPKARERVERIRDAAVRSQSLAVLLSAVSTTAEGLRESVPIGGVLVVARALLDSRLRAAGARVEVEVRADLPPVPADRNTLVMLVTTLLDLALGNGSGTQDEQTIRVTADLADSGPLLQIRIAGPGVQLALLNLASQAATEEALRLKGAHAAAESLGGRLVAAGEASGGGPALFLELPVEFGRKSERSGPNSSNMI